MLKVYEVEYASSAYYDNPQKANIYSNKELEVGDTIIVENIDRGIFIARVVSHIEPKYIYENDYEIKASIPRRFYKKINIGDFYKKIDNQKRKIELEKEMEEKFEELDRKLKYKYYADQDDDFKKLFDEYNNL